MLERPTRRGFLLGAAATLITAPAIVRASSIMQVRALKADNFGWFVTLFGRDQWGNHLTETIAIRGGWARSQETWYGPLSMWKGQGAPLNGLTWYEGKSYPDGRNVYIERLNYAPLRDERRIVGELLPC